MPADRATRRDPLLCAGHLTCRTCGRRGWPLDAVWLGDDLILATYESPCWHDKRPATLVVFPSELEPASRLEPERCQATVRNGPRKGQPCTILARPGSQFCACHQQ